MTILLLLMFLIYGIPIFAVLSFLIYLYYQKQTNLLLLLIFFVLSFALWTFSSLPWQLDLDMKEETIQSLFKLGLIGGFSGLVMLMMIFSRSFISYKVSILARISMTIYIILIGIAIASLIEPSNEFYTIINSFIITAQ